MTRRARRLLGQDAENLETRVGQIAIRRSRHVREKRLRIAP